MRGDHAGHHSGLRLSGLGVGILGAILVLLAVNATLQYAAGPALHHALPLSQETRAEGGGVARHLPRDGLLLDVAPGGADAELLCVDKAAGCDASDCSQLSARYQSCKATCNTCDALRGAIQAETGLQIRVVQQLSPCLDLHPSCATWAKGGRCSREAKSMLALCQASCGFCLPPVPATAGSTGSGSSTSGDGGSSDSSSSGSSSSSSGSSSGSSSSSSGSSQASIESLAQQAAEAGGAEGSSSGSGSSEGMLDECQDDVSVCPFLAAQGLCGGSSGRSLWLETQCSRSCGQCAPGRRSASRPPRSGSAAAAGEQPAAQQATPAVAAAGGQGLPAASPYASALKQALVGAGSPTPYRIRGRHKPGDPVTSSLLLEWPVPHCADSQGRCSAWAAAGECNSTNADYMAIACKATCANCRLLATREPLPMLQLSSGRAMPAVGFGTAGLGVGTAAAVQYAAQAGYRMFDSAESRDWYDEEAVAAGLAASKVPRSELFLISKIHPRDLGFNQTLAAFQRSLAHLGTDHLDLLLLHYPHCFNGANCIPHPKQHWHDSWRALEQLVAQGRVHSIGVSNFDLGELRELLSRAKVPPAVLEARSDPFAINHHLINFALQHNMAFIGYSSLGSQWINSPVSINPVLTSKLLKEVAANHPGKSVVQVVLRWALQRGQVVIPRSASTEHIRENLQLFDFALSDLEMQAINSLDGTWKTGGLPLPVA